ncbi:DUF6624 domain-containing protein [Deminuibacter soli]|nr:DUF6624 domain-containing protein [Deminuibacter soli]
MNSTAGYSQTGNQDTYDALAQKAYEYYNAKAYRQSAELNTRAYQLPGEKGTGNHRYDAAYNAACAWALAGEADSAFVLLQEITVRGKYNDYKSITSDADFASLHKDSRWATICNAVKKNQADKENNTHAGVAAELDTLYLKDQQYRFSLMSLQQQMQAATGDAKDKIKQQFTALAMQMKEQDSINLRVVEGILNRYGWLGADEVGENGSQALFLVIQHADLATQQRYLPMIKQAAENGKTKAANLALLEDRIALREKRKQVYGSQVWTDPATGKKYVDMLANPENVDQRRQQVGLPPMSVYLGQFFQMQWDAHEYATKILPELEKIKGQYK